MFGIGTWELIIIFVIALLIFGPKKIPELARTLGKGLAEFRRATQDIKSSLDLDLNQNYSYKIDHEIEDREKTNDVKSDIEQSNEKIDEEQKFNNSQEKDSKN